MSSTTKWLLKMDHYPEFEIHDLGFDPHHRREVPSAGHGSRRPPPHLLGDGISFYVDDLSVGMQLHQGDTSGQHYEQAKLRLIEPGSQGRFRQARAYLLSHVLVEHSQLGGYAGHGNGTSWYVELSCKSSRLTA